jgi:hypothetical protein
MRPTEGSVVALACLLATLANGTLLASLAAFAFDAKLVPASDLLRTLTGDFAGYTPFRPGLALLHLVQPAWSPTNALAILADLHVRPFILAAAFIGLLKAVPWATDWLEAAREPQETDLSRRDRALRWIANRSLVVRPARWIERARELTYHPWQYLTSSNRRRELTMVDVLTHEGSLYCGKLEYWIPEGNGLAALSMTRVLRFYPVQEDETRRRTVVPNKGELVVPMSEIRTAHIWRLVRGVRLAMSVRKRTDIERLKWLMDLDFEHPGYVAALDVHVGLSFDDRERFELELTEWLDSRNMPLSDRVKLLDSEPSIASSLTSLSGN